MTPPKRTRAFRHDHLRIIKIKPELVVSNGDVLRGYGFYHYLVGMAIWLPLTVGLLMLIYYTLLPLECREALRTGGNRRAENAQRMTVFALVWVLALFFLVVSLIAALFGFTGISAAAAGIAKILFFIFIVIFVVLLIAGLMLGRALF